MSGLRQIAFDAKEGIGKSGNQKELSDLIFSDLVSGAPTSFLARFGSTMQAVNGTRGQSNGPPMKVGKDKIVGAFRAISGEARAMNIRRKRIASAEREFLSMPGLSVEQIEPDSAFSIRKSRFLGMFKRLPINSNVIVSRRALPRVVLDDWRQRPQLIIVDPTNLTKTGGRSRDSDFSRWRSRDHCLRVRGDHREWQPDSDRWRGCKHNGVTFDRQFDQRVSAATAP
ncbi:hypothetical protein JJC00_08490 [Bradyrhizobium diazoefficiens]|uniref:hypothetical protein n=1 Tax=Bradyrhizobium diazoefficiens TaxID=1355477 RepID=UPI00190A4C58|nr:hypothetical protein [Bradyrhizobium diazoefficiens]QQO35609.1 hypothetical protein JJC00_08490 [Bradyrhizobium diazoefficiens]